MQEIGRHGDEGEGTAADRFVGRDDEQGHVDEKHLPPKTKYAQPLIRSVRKDRAIGCNPFDPPVFGSSVIVVIVVASIIVVVVVLSLRTRRLTPSFEARGH